ncbi:MAG TPA: enoyl-CoA hydratase-related protein [Acetobacteraceae bacterium]|jgi:enoyl-CoA hydratase|nr:enoyl-CoA hydratase-related protein [Acetobacteraceae bacterium]
MSEPAVLYETSDKVAIITLNRPDSLNAINTQLKMELTAAYLRADEDAATTVVVLRAAGRSFCSGYDISSGATDKDPWRHDALKWHAHLAESLEFEMMPWYMRKPVIASVQGHALGGGCEITMFCDITIAADNALFGEPEVRFSDVGPAIVMPWLVGYKKARELLYLGDMIDADEAQRLGMVNRIVPLAELPAATLKFARRLALISPEALYASKLAISRGADVAGFRNAMQAGLDMVAPLYAAKSEVGLAFTDMTRKHGLRAALKWRRDQFDAVEREG